MAGVSDILTAIQNGTVAANNLTQLLRNATGTNLSGQAALRVSGLRQQLTAPLTVYVNQLTGSSANSGFASTSAVPTIQQGTDIIGGLDAGTFQTTVSVAAGSYTESVALPGYVGALPPIISGDTTTPSNVTLTNGSGSYCFTNDSHPPWTIQGLKLQATVGGGLNSVNSASINFGAMEFSSVNAGFAQVRAAQNGTVTALSSYIVTGGGGFHFATTTGGAITVISLGIAVSNTPTFIIFANAQQTGNIYVSGSSFTGAATGQRYSATLNGVIYTGTGSSTFFPGTVAGVTAAGGQYG